MAWPMLAGLNEAANWGDAAMALLWFILHPRASIGDALRWLLGAVCVAMPLSAWAEDAPKIRRFGDWEAVCENGDQEARSASSSPASTERTCKAVQRLAVQGTNETVFVLTVVPGEKDATVAIVSVPLGGYIVPGIEFSVDGGKPYKLLIETCTAAGCHAGFPLAGRVDREMRSGKRASFRVWTTKSKPTDVSVSLNGFADAMGHLGRRS
jgi:invasion protein IalB